MNPTTPIGEVKLSEAQKKVISDMRKGTALYFSNLYQKYKMAGHVINARVINKLVSERLIEQEGLQSIGYLYVLTELGRTISI